MLPRRSSAGSLYGAQLGTDQHAIQPKERWGSAALSPRYGLPPATTMQGRAGSSGTLLRPSRPLSRGRERPPTAASSRAAYGSKGALEVAAAAIELHGGVGRQPQALPYPGAGPALERQRCDGLQQRSARPSSANAELGGRTAPAEPAALTESLVTALASPRGRGCGSPYALPASSLPLPPPAQPPASAPPESVSIHVCDDARGLRKTFRCELPLLLTHMRYFEAYLSSSCADELDISVHCDVQVFEWLMQYVRSAGGGPQPGPAVPRLEVGNCVSLLISSEFLMMGGLVAECERFIAAHASQVALLPIDLSCIHDGAIARCGGGRGAAAARRAAREDPTGAARVPPLTPLSAPHTAPSRAQDGDGAHARDAARAGRPQGQARAAPVRRRLRAARGRAGARAHALRALRARLHGGAGRVGGVRARAADDRPARRALGEAPAEPALGWAGVGTRDRAAAQLSCRCGCGRDCPPSSSRLHAPLTCRSCPPLALRLLHPRSSPPCSSRR